MTELAKGANTAVDPGTVDIAVAGAAQGSVDLMIFQLTESRVVRSDADLVFFNQPVSPEGAVRMTGPDRIGIDLAGVPADVAVLAVAVCLDDSVPGGLGERPGLAVTLAGDVSARSEGLSSERAAVLVELYRRAGGWKVRNVSAGWKGGLAAMVSEHGVSVDEELAAPPPQTSPTAVPPVAPPPPVLPLPPGAFPPPSAYAAAPPPPSALPPPSAPPPPPAR